MERIIKIVNSVQVAFYMNRGVNPIKFYPDGDRLIFEFREGDTKEAWGAWRTHCDNRRNSRFK